MFFRDSVSTYNFILNVFYSLIPALDLKATSASCHHSFIKLSNFFWFLIDRGFLRAK